MILDMFRRRKNRKIPDSVIGALLVRYLKPYRLPTNLQQKDWIESLDADYIEVIKHLLKSGYLRKPTTEESLQFARVKDMKSVLKKYDHKVSGRKVELIRRLNKNIPKAAKRLVEVHANDVFVSTETGSEKALKFKKERKRRKTEAIKQTRKCIKVDDLLAACNAINKYYKWLPIHMRPGMNIDWDDPHGGSFLSLDRATLILKSVQDSWIVQDLPNDLRQSFIWCAAENELWPDHKTIDEYDVLNDCRLKRSPEAIVNDIKSWAHSAAIRQNQVEISDSGVEMRRVWHTANDWCVCPICGPLNGKPEQDWQDQFPDGPPAHPRCRCDTGLSAKKLSKLRARAKELAVGRVKMLSDLEDINLSGKDLKWAGLVGANLRGSDLSGADMSNADIRKADLSNSNLRDVNLQGVNLSESNLNKTNLQNAKVNEAQLSKAKSLQGTILPDGTKLSEENWQVDFNKWRSERSRS